MHGLNQSLLLTYDNLVENLREYGYKPSPNSICIWTHETRQTEVCLCIDDFGVKYFHEKDTDHLLQSFKKELQLCC